MTSSQYNNLLARIEQIENKLDAIQQILSTQFDGYEFVSYEEAQKMTGLKRSTLYWKRCKGQMPKCDNAPKRLPFKRADLVAWIKSGMPNLENQQ